jgi:hypothetical protein
MNSKIAGLLLSATCAGVLARQCMTAFAHLLAALSNAFIIVFIDPLVRVSPGA